MVTPRNAVIISAAPGLIYDALVNSISTEMYKQANISLLIEMGFTPVDIAKRVGHENINITMHYAHMFPQKQDEMIDKLEDKNNLLEEEISWTDTKKKKELTEATESETK
jgi:prephenate dehydrogenase